MHPTARLIILPQPTTHLSVCFFLLILYEIELTESLVTCPDLNYNTPCQFFRSMTEEKVDMLSHNSVRFLKLDISVIII